tara:strand:+ start:2254 stop:4269 length:2016 start_codon:yes stop_codon:yes gene_type:complete
VANYDVSIKIAVAGAKQLDKVNKKTAELQKNINEINRKAEQGTAGMPVVRNFENLSKAVTDARSALDKAAIGTKEFNQAVKNVVKVEDKFNRQQKIKNRALKVEELRIKEGLTLKAAKIRVTQEEIEAEARLAKAKERTANADRIAATKRRNRIIQSAGIGGGFPLLFGGGIQGSLAGGLGGGIGEALSPGGGFAGSIVATAVVRLATDFANGITEVGKAMNESSKEFDRVQNILGKDGANKISAFATETELLTKTFGDFFLSVQSGIGGLITTSGILANIISSMQRGLARNQVLRSDEFKQRVKGLKSKGAQGKKRTAILNEMVDAQFEQNVQGTANLEADKSAELIEKELQGLERKLELDAADNHAMARAIELRHKQVDIVNSLKAAGAVIVEQDLVRINNLLRDVQLLEDKKDLELFFKENAKEMRSIEDQDEKNLADTLKKLEKLDESANATTENMRKQNELNLVKLTGTEYEIALKEQLLSLDKEELARFDEEKFKIEFNNKLRIDGLMKQKQLTEEIKTMIAQDMGNAIKGLITGTQSLNDSLRNVLNNMANAFLNFGLFGNFGGTFEKGAGLLGSIFKAEGGPVKRGGSYIVGERGPEMFSPGTSGTITPNHALGGSTNIVVNVDASGSSIEGDEQQGRELGRLISVAIQSELIREKRPGGLLA